MRRLAVPAQAFRVVAAAVVLVLAACGGNPDKVPLPPEFTNGKNLTDSESAFAAFDSPFCSAVFGNPQEVAAHLGLSEPLTEPQVDGGLDGFDCWWWLDTSKRGKMPADFVVSGQRCDGQHAKAGNVYVYPGHGASLLASSPSGRVTVDSATMAGSATPVYTWLHESLRQIGWPSCA